MARSRSFCCGTPQPWSSECTVIGYETIPTERPPPDADTNEKSLFYTGVFRPAHRHLFRPGHDLDAAVRYMVTDGYLHNILAWIVDWLYLRNHQRSMLLTYEQFLGDRDRFLNRLSQFLYGRDIPASTLEKVHGVADGYSARRSSDTERSLVYPCGWTGEPNAWRNYYSNANREIFQTTVKNFMQFYPHASLILDAYPDLPALD